MSEVDSSKLEQMLQDISEIKTVINDNRPLLRHLFLPQPLRIVGIIGGLSVILFCLAFYFLNARYGSHANIPVGIKYTLYCLLLADWIFIATLKNRKIIRSMKAVDPGYSLFKVFNYLHSFQFLHMYLPMVIIIFCLVGLSIYHGQLEFIVPIISIGVGIMYNAIGVIVRIREYLIAGYWMVLTGLLAMVFPQVSPLIDCAVSIGGGIFIFGMVKFSPETVE